MSKPAFQNEALRFVIYAGFTFLFLLHFPGIAHAQTTSTAPVVGQPEWSQFLFGPGGITGANNIMSGIETGIVSAIKTAGASLGTAAKAIFSALAVLGFAWTFGQLAMRRSDLGEILAELVRYIVVTGLFFYLLTNMQSIADAIITTVNAASGTSGTGGANSPDTVFGQGLTYFKTGIIQNGIINGVYTTYQTCFKEHHVGIFGDVDSAVHCDVPALGISALMLLLGALVVVIYLMIAIDILILRISFWAVTYIGLILLGFGGQGSVRDIAVKYLRTVGSHGMSLLAIQVIAGAGLQVFTANTAATPNGAVTLNIVGQLFEIIVIYLLAHKIPYIIGGMVAGDAGGHSAGVGAGAIGYAAEAGVAAGLMMASGGGSLAGGAAGGGRPGGSDGPLGPASSIGGGDGAGLGGGGAGGGGFMDPEGSGGGGSVGGVATSGSDTPLGEALGSDADGDDSANDGTAGAEPGATGGPAAGAVAEDASSTDGGRREGGSEVGGSGPGSSSQSGGASGAGRSSGGGSTAGSVVAAAAAGGALAGVGRAVAASSQAVKHVSALGTGQHGGFGAQSAGYSAQSGVGRGSASQSAASRAAPSAAGETASGSIGGSSGNGSSAGVAGAPRASSPSAAATPQGAADAYPAASRGGAEGGSTGFGPDLTGSAAESGSTAPAAGTIEAEDVSPSSSATPGLGPAPGTEAADIRRGSQEQADDIAQGPPESPPAPFGATQRPVRRSTSDE